MTTLTAVLCNYNHGKLIARAIEAMLSQSRPPDQLVIVDDGSTDESRDVIQSWADRSPTILFLKNERNLGFHASAARAIAAATGDFLYSGAADDYILPGFFEQVCRLMEAHPAAGVGCAKVVTCDSHSSPQRSDGYRHVSEARYLPPQEYLNLCLEGEPPTHSLSGATIYRREELLRVGGWRPELGSWSDTFSIRAIALRTGMCYIPQDAMMWTVLPGSMSQTTGKDPLKAMTLVRKAAALMRAPEFADVFPAWHVDRWESAYVAAIALLPLQPAMQGYQAVSDSLKATGQDASWPLRAVLGLLRQTMTACYLTAHRLQKKMLLRKLLKLEREHDAARGPSSPSNGRA